MSWRKKLLTLIVILLFLGVVTIATLVSMHYIDNWGWILVCVMLIYAINITFNIYIFYSEHRTDKEKKCWMMLNIVVPLIGPIVFMKYGFYAYYKNNVDSIKKLQQQINKNYDSKPVKVKNQLFETLSKYSSTFFGSKPVNGNITRLEDVELSFKESINIIRSAKKVILISFYIVADSQWLKALSNELILKAQEGVKVYIIYDPIGSKKKYPKNLMKNFELHGIKTCRFKPQKTFMLTSADNNRSHKKVIIADGLVALTGGINISDEYINYSSKYHYWFDEAYIATGEIVNELTKSFLIDWNIYSDDKDPQRIKEILKTNILFEKKKPNNAIMQLYDSNPEIVQTRMEQFLYLAFANAKKKICIYTPYLYLSESMLNLLVSQSQIGVKIQIVVPRFPDNKSFIVHINQLQYKQLLDAGIEIYEIDGFIHRKSMMIDDMVMTGTCNLDQRAMTINYETALMIDDKKFATDWLREFNRCLDKSKKIMPDFKKDISIKGKILVKLLMISEILL